ncbi:MAG: signal peptide peptidase SppA [Trueperaceae bacterium]|nr:signal peptide peptidase SppA [Trueperaceae bacterium]
MSDFHPVIIKLALQNTLRSASNFMADLARDKPKAVLIELSGSLPMREKKRKWTEFPPEFGPKPLSIEQLEHSITQIAEAAFIEKVIFRFEAMQLGLTSAEILRKQFARLQAAGKKVIVYASQLGMASYYLASLADELVLPESAELQILGFALEQSFLKDALGRFGIEAEKVAIKEYKTAGDTLVRSHMSETDREQLSALLEGFEDHLYSEIAKARKVELETVKGWINKGISSAEVAREVGMIDRVAYEDELIGEKHVLVEEAQRFLKSNRRSLTAGRVGVITLEGAIMTGKSRRSPVPFPLIGGTFAGSESLIAAFRAAEEDDTTKAIVFYVDSGGGSALASDLIWREVARINPLKPIIAVMGQYAASGGYYVLTHAQKVLASPTTLTGSIGVVGTQLILEEFNAKYGINVDVIQRGRFARVNSSAKSLDPEERAYLERSIAEVYDRFISRVAEGRKLTKERVNELGRGRIWTGQAALEHGLVDELGDIFKGISIAKEVAKLAPDARVYNVSVPKNYKLPQVDSLETFIDSFNPLLNERLLLIHPWGVRLRV